MLKLGMMLRHTGETLVDPIEMMGQVKEVSRKTPSTDNTLGPYKPSRRYTWHSPAGKHHSQTDHILVRSASDLP